MQHLTLTRPDDWHLHLRDGDTLTRVLPHTAAVFGRAIVMPNLKPPVTTVAAARAYRERILAALPEGNRFEPLMTLYLTESTPPAEIRVARESGFVHGVKLYPAGATTHSEAGVRDPANVYRVLEAMEAADLPLLVHGEVVDPRVDPFDRERVFIERHLAPLVERFPRLRVVMEHITTTEAVQFVREAREGVAATVTPQHILMNRGALFEGGLRPHHYCLPVLKRERHRRAVLEAAVSGSPRFFLGTDSAPHPRRAKEAACGCAGIYSALTALPLYAEAFEAAGRLERLEGFASHFGADFYRLPRNGERITLERRAQAVPASIPLDGDELIPLRAGGEVAWRVVVPNGA
ncbi:MAG TPA: dihydroorotase [Thiotrichales bacterium]|nr:dihydroorotase [Thiotrichales bacterium]